MYKYWGGGGGGGENHMKCYILRERKQQSDNFDGGNVRNRVSPIDMTEHRYGGITNSD